MPEKIYVGDLESLVDNKKVEGKQLKIANENFYKISNVDKMRPFFMSIVSNSNHWMFISSTGSLSAGRKNSEFALFPYYTDDKITESSETTGSKTILIAKITGKKAACLLTVSDNLVTHEETTAEERQSAFTRMMDIALGLAE